MSILGTRVVRTEDPLFLTRGATYTDDLTDERLTGALHATFVRSQVAHGRLLSVDTRRPWRRRGWSPVVTAADLADLVPLPPPFPFINQAMTRPWLASDRVRFVGDPIAVVLTEERYQGEDAAELVVVDIDPLPGRGRHRRRRARRGAAVPGGGHQRDRPRSATPATRRTSSTGARSSSPRRSSTSGSPPCRWRAAPRPRPGAGRPGDACGAPTRAPSRPAAARRLARAGPRPDPPDHPRRRRRVRRQDRRRPGVRPGRLAGQARRPAGRAGPRAASENMRRHAARPGPGAGRHHRRPPGRHGRGLQPGLRPGLRRLPADRRGAAHADPADGARRVRHPEGAVDGPRAGHQHHLDRRLPRRRPARRPPPRSSGRWTCSPPRSAWTRPTCAGGTWSPAFDEPHTTPMGAVYDSGDYAGRAGQGARGRRLRRTARRAGARGARAGDVRQLGIGLSVVRGDHRAENGAGDRGGRRARGAPRRHRDGADRHLAARPGPRDGLGDDRQRPARHPGGEDHRACTATPTWCPRAAARWARAACSRAAPPCTRPPAS